LIISLKNIKSYFRIIFISFILFIYIYAIKLSMLPLGLDKVVLIFLSLLIFPFHIKTFLTFLKNNTVIIKYFGLLILLFAYNGLIFSFNISNDFTLFYSLILRLTVFYFPIVFILFYLNVHRHNNFYFLLKLLLFVITIQSVLILISFINFDFKIFVDNLLPYTGNIDVTRLDRMRGFSNTSGASLSIVQGIGAYIALLLLDKTNITHNKIIYLIFILINILALLFVARTGLVLFLVTSSIYFLITISYKTLKSLFYILLGFIIIFYIVLNFQTMLDPKYIELFYIKILPWALELFSNLSNGSATTASNQELWNMIHFPNNFKTLCFGDGIFDRPYTLSDSGYVRYIYAMGIVGTGLLLFTIIYPILTIIKYIKKNKKEFFWVTILISFMLLIEIKEPFLLKPQVYPLLLLLLFSYVIHLNTGKYNAKNNISH